MNNFKPRLVTAPANDALSLAELKVYLRIPSAVTDHDTLFNNLILSAIGNADAYSGHLGRCLINQVWRTRHENWCVRFKSPFPDVSAAVLKYTDTDGVEQTVSSDDYLVYDEFIQMKSTYSYPSLYEETEDPVRIEWTCGYGATSAAVPPDIKTGLCSLVAHWWENPEAVVPNERRVELEDTPYAYKAMIARYGTGFVV